ncbi:MAG: DotA/TraY family protein [Rhodospirillales bacterium]|nr:DotA/TraY family protein [Rhodospirillales bacterium]
MQSITRKNFIRYAVLPGFRQRFRDLFASGLQYVPYFIALVYGSVRLLPASHPYLNPANMGRFGVRHVIAEAANNIVFSTRNIDQILLFICILFGLILATLQIGLLGMAVFMQPALAAMPATFPGFFSTAASGNETQDLAHIMMDMVFGVPGIFNSCVSQPGVACTNIQGNAIATAAGAPGLAWSYSADSPFPFAIHRGLHQLFQLYNIGLTVVAAFIGIYFLFTVALETAESGTPMGRRFNKVWAPVRFVVAFGLLFPIGYGYNSSQYIVLYAAKFGSGFATNGWNLFNDTLNNAFGAAFENLLSDDTASAASLIGVPEIPEMAELLKFLYSAKVCEYAYLASSDGATPIIEPWLVADPVRVPPAFKVTSDTTYADLINFADGEDRVVMRFGIQDQDKFGHLMGYVQPTCGEMLIKLTDPRPIADQEAGIRLLQQFYFENTIRDSWFTTITMGVPHHVVKKHLKTTYNTGDGHPVSYDPDIFQPHSIVFRALYDFLKISLKDHIDTVVVDAMTQSGRWKTDETLRDKGWAGAAIWYNRIAEMNGAMTSAVLNIPTPVRYPKVMEQVYAKKRQSEANVEFDKRFDPSSTTGSATAGLSEPEKLIATVLWIAFDFAQNAVGTGTSHADPTGNMVVDTLNAVFGTNGFFSMRDNSDIHPLAQLTALGRGLIEASVRNLGIAGLGGAAGSLTRYIDPGFGNAAKISAGFIVSFSTITMTAGFVLFYVVPFLPFIYFFFAVGGWVKGIFEAMVGAPLWALAHLRIDGNGLAGPAAVGGYFLIFEVFLRPILIIFGLLASISTFSALVYVLNQIFDLVVANVGGFDAELELTGPPVSKIAEWRSAIDEFFFTVIYVIIVYLMGMSSFKLVDLIPNNILRWMGQSVASFGDQSEDSGQALVGTATVGSQQTLSSVGGGLKGLLK